jgi:hypothetical protein
MKTFVSVASGFVLCLALGGSASAEEVAKKPIEVHNGRVIKAKVIAIDHATRDITLEEQDGSVTAMKVSESITRFDSMKVGDTVTAHFNESVVYDIKKPGTAAAPDTVAEKGGKFTGDKPGGARASVSTTTVTVLKIDASKPSVTVRGSDGQIITVPVKNPENLKQIKVGDVVVVTKTEAMMVSVE